MKKVKKQLLTAITMGCMTFSSGIMAEDSLHHSGQASKHTSLAAVHGAASTATVASAVVATPLIVAGGVSMAAGSVTAGAGNAIAESIENKPVVLEISDKTITVDPAPNQVVVVKKGKH